VRVASLRQKLERVPAHPEFILTGHRQGYRFAGLRSRHGLAGNCGRFLPGFRASCSSFGVSGARVVSTPDERFYTPRSSHTDTFGPGAPVAPPRAGRARPHESSAMSIPMPVRGGVRERGTPIR
jgi:hypothetical protein